MSADKILEKRVGEKVKRIPRVSIVIPAYNVAEFIAETLDSIRAQTFTDYETILVNDGSPDTEQLEKTLAPYFDEIIYIKQANSGVAAARNRAIRVARGAILAFLDGDDIWLPAYLASQVAALNTKKCDLIYSSALLFGEAQKKHRIFTQKIRSHGKVNAESLISAGCNVILSGTIVKREKVLECGMFDEDLPRIGIEDFDLWLRLAKAGARLDYQNKILLKYRVRSNSLSGSNVQRVERLIAGLDIIKQKYTLTHSEQRAVEKHKEFAGAQLEIEKGKYNITQGNFAAARKNFLKANRYFRLFKLQLVVWLITVNPTLIFQLFKLMRTTEFAFIAPKNLRDS